MIKFVMRNSHLDLVVLTSTNRLLLFPFVSRFLLSGMRTQAEDAPELMQNIQSRLPVKEAARTCVLSKSWLHAWSTIPILRFDVRRGKSMKLVDGDRTLMRYLRDNTPIERFDLMIDIESQESASHVEKWIGAIATKSCLREMSLSIDIALLRTSLTLPDEILSELYLNGVRISEEALHDILSSCSLLEKIELLDSCKGFKTFKVKNLLRLYELRIDLDAVHSTALEISDVPNLGVFSYDLHVCRPQMPIIPFNALSISLGRSVTRLMLGGVITDNACLETIKTEFPFLESLTLDMTSWMLGSFYFTCASIKRLSLLSCRRMLIDVQVYAPKLFFFEFGGNTLPSLLFPVSSLKQIKVSLSLIPLIDADFFLKMRETLTLSRMCYLNIITDNSKLPLDIDIDDLRTRLLFPPARNVQELAFQTVADECLWERSQFFDAFFEICHPKHVFARPDSRFRHNNHFCRLMLKEVLEKKTRIAYWPHYLKHVQIRQYRHQKWKTLTVSHRSFLDGSAPGVYMYFKLMWR
ncbi:unnamed protein product [Lactuca saligna]|uniref:FBD domain-containing protein n=1 Tax=Lactuca saligna TaxID=75948 RepID=A0AA35YH19_LACSI|nr:unnamed protein product [Lactuca saligna]